MKMQESDWRNILNFTPDEKWGDWSLMDAEVFYILDVMRSDCDKPIIIHCGYEADGHTKTSQHYLGKAVDCHIVGMNIVEQYIFAERYQWIGIGVYPNSNNPYLHLDIRTLEEKQYRMPRWGGIYETGEDGKRTIKYVPFDYNLMQIMMGA